MPQTWLALLLAHTSMFGAGHKGWAVPNEWYEKTARWYVLYVVEMARLSIHHKNQVKRQAHRLDNPTLAQNLGGIIAFWLRMYPVTVG